MKTKLFYLLLFVIGVTYGQIPTSGLSANYDFTSGAFTDAANAVTLTQTGAALTTIDDRIAGANNAISLNGDYLTRTNISYPNSGSDIDVGTISFWIKTSTDDGNLRTILDDTVGRSDATTDNTWAGYYFYLRDGKVGVSGRVEYSNNSSYQGIGKVSNYKVSDNSWHHVVATIRGDLRFTGASDIAGAYVTLYVDGVSQGTSSVTRVSSLAAGGVTLRQSLDTGGDVTIGNNLANNLPDINRYFDEIDDVNFYSRQVTQAEVTQLATVNSFCFPPLESNVSVSNITETTTDISWTESGTFDLAYVIKGEPFANATILSNINYTANALQSLTSLQASTIYNVYLRTPCTSSINSSWSSPKEFRTNGITYVNKNATGSNDGTSWVNAYTDLQDALSILQDNGKVWVAQGTYIPGVSNRNSSFSIGKTNIELYGGFVGTETALNQRDFRANITILSGDLLGDDGGNLTGTTRLDNAFHIIEANATGSLIDGFTISDGYANDTGDNSTGAGIFKPKAINSLSVKNCIIKNNYASYAAGIGAEYTSSGGILDIENCVFDNNLARHSSALSAWGRTTGSFTFNISNSLFSNNEASGSTGFAGSAGWFRAMSQSAIVNVNLINNTYAKNNDTGGDSRMNNLNRATIGASESAGELTLEVANCVFWDNTVTGNVVANSITGIHEALGQNVTATNSIDQASFSKLTPANVTNINNSDPLFTSATDFTLQSGSPAMNLGVNSYLPATITKDLSGNDRISAGTIDAGAYEFQCASCLGINTFVVGKGSVTQSGAVYTNGDTVTLTATPNTGWVFDGWSGDETGATNPLTITINSNLTITATFSKLKTYVNKNATGNNDGTSWANAYVSLQDAISNASIDEVIWIAGGTYKPGATQNDSFIFSDDNIKLYGSFSGTETELIDRNFSSKTILSGDINGDDSGVGITGFNRSDNSKTVVTVNGNNILFDGLIISDGHYNSSASGEGSGSAIFKNDAVTSLTLKNCEINNNFSYTAGAIMAYYSEGGSLIIENCKFDNNNARYASGVYLLTGASKTVSVDVANSLFTNNISKDRSSSAKGFTGSSMWIRANYTSSSVTTTITNCTFAKNIDIGTQSGSSRGTLGLSRRTDNSSTHPLVINNTIFYHNVGVNGVVTKSLNEGHVWFASPSNINNTIDEDNFSVFNSLSSFNNVSDSDPLFNNVSNNDFTLQSGSPAINSGDNSKIPSGVIYDLSGNQRIVNNVVDIGAYEYDASLIQRTLTINATNGSVSTNPNPTNGTYDDGTVVALTATPATGYQFDGWSGDVTGTTNPLSITMDTDKTVTATFSLIERTLTINATNGRVNVTGASNSKNQNNSNDFYFDHGETTSITAVPNAGYQFDGWSGDANGSANPLSLTMDADKTITATFSPIQHTLTINATNGNVTANPSPVNGTYDEGTIVTLTANPISSFGFVNWSGDVSGATNPITVTIDANKTVTANFSSTAGVSDSNSVSFSIYPNPTNSILNIKTDEKISKIDVYNLQGQRIKTLKNKQINIQKLSSGIYIIKITTTDKKVGIRRIIKN